MQQRVNILVVTPRKIWAQSLADLTLSTSKNVLFYLKGKRKQSFYAFDYVLLDVIGLANKQINKFISQYSDFSLFLVIADGKKIKVQKGINVSAVFVENISVRNLVASIELIVQGLQKLEDFAKLNHSLTIYEALLLEGLLNGASNKKLARTYDINVSQVKYHLQKIYRKLGVNNRLEAALIGRQIIV